MVSAELYGAVSAPLLDVTLSSTMDHHGRDVFEGVLEEAEWMVTPELRERFEEECRFFRDTGYDSALAELICIGHELRRVGHVFQVEGAAAGSAVLYLAGLTPLNPVSLGLLTERFIDIGRKRRGWPWSGQPVAEPDYFAARVSMSLQEFLLVLRRRGYLIGMTTETIPGLSYSLTAEPRGARNTNSPTHLVFTASATAVLSNFLDPREREASVDDVQTWHLLAAGSTEGIEALDCDIIRGALRSRRPRSLEELTDVLAVTQLGTYGLERAERQGTPVYQEDLMRELHASLGIGLRDAYELVRTLGNPLSPLVSQARDAFFQVKPPNPLSPREWNRLWDRLVEECPVAVCKANYMATAHHGLQAAYLKAHHPAEFRAVLQLAGA